MKEIMKKLEALGADVWVDLVPAYGECLNDEYAVEGLRVLVASAVSAEVWNAIDKMGKWATDESFQIGEVWGWFEEE